MPKPEPEPGEMIPEEAATGKKGKRKKKKKGVKAVSFFIIVSSLYDYTLFYMTSKSVMKCNINVMIFILGR